MNLQVLKSALEYYVQSAECAERQEAKACMLAYASLLSIEKEMAINTDDSNEIMPVPLLTIDEIINENYYDVIGPIIKHHMQYYTPAQFRRNDALRNVVVAEATEQIRSMNITAGVLPMELLESGIQFVIDLWLDNEKDDANSSDGTFDARSYTYEHT